MISKLVLKLQSFLVRRVILPFCCIYDSCTVTGMYSCYYLLLVHIRVPWRESGPLLLFDYYCSFSLSLSLYVYVCMYYIVHIECVFERVVCIINGLFSAGNSIKRQLESSYANWIWGDLNFVPSTGIANKYIMNNGKTVQITKRFYTNPYTDKHVHIVSSVV